MDMLSRRLMGGWTDLHVAAAAGDLARVRLAVQKNPTDVDRVTKDRQTALHLAAAAGFDAVVGELLDRHARTTMQDEAGRTPLHAAAVAGHGRCVSALLGPRNRISPAERAQLLGARNREGRDALAAAVAAGQAAAVQELLKGGADAAGARDASGCGLLITAVRHGHTHLLPLLAPACGLEQRDPATGATPLHVAAAAGLSAPLAWLLAAGASTLTRDNAGRTAGEAALAAGQHAAARTIREVALTGLRIPSGTAGGGASGGGGGPASPAGSSGGGAPSPYGGGLPYGSRYNHSLLQPAGQTAAAPQAPVATPWQMAAAAVAGQGQTPPLPPPVAVGAGRLQIPDAPPAAVYYPTPPPGAGVYF